MFRVVDIQNVLIIDAYKFHNLSTDQFLVYEKKIDGIYELEILINIVVSILHPTVFTHKWNLQPYYYDRPFHCSIAIVL